LAAGAPIKNNPLRKTTAARNRGANNAGIQPPQPIKPVTSIGYGLFDSGDNHTIPFVEALWKQEGRKLRVISRHFFLP
jgi:hypothetical protein